MISLIIDLLLAYVGPPVLKKEKEKKKKPVGDVGFIHGFLTSLS